MALYELRQAGPIGLGLFAKRDIPAGTRLIEEEPLLAVPRDAGMTNLVLRSFWDLTPEQRDMYMMLFAREKDEDEDEGENGTEWSDTRELGLVDSDDGKGAAVPGSEDCGEEDEVVVDDDLLEGALGVSDMGNVAEVGMEPGSSQLDESKQSDIAVDLDSAQHGGVGDLLAYDESPKPSHSGSGITDAFEPLSKSNNPATAAFPCTQSPDPPPTCLAATILNIFETNALGCEVTPPSTSSDPRTPPRIYANICLTASRLNHSCLPNVFCSYNNASGTHVVHATRDISRDEQLHSSYIPGTYQTTSSRRAALAKWGFRCECHACSDPRRARSDGQRERLRELQAVYDAERQSFNTDMTQGGVGRAMEALEAMIGIMEAEGLVGPEVGYLCGRLGICCIAARRSQEAVLWLGKKVEILRCCYGEDNPVYFREARLLDILRLRLGSDL
ncbi:hypothetical protein AAFC00_004974 [Neodothiora populina]|uniref:SET domain-containing protein n=1 Tax=Neodothiora populina TaxID=2781224 RepID=A0ABR3P439_9PEZI